MSWGPTCEGFRAFTAMCGRPDDAPYSRVHVTHLVHVRFISKIELSIQLEQLAHTMQCSRQALCAEQAEADQHQPSRQDMFTALLSVPILQQR